MTPADASTQLIESTSKAMKLSAVSTIQKPKKLHETDIMKQTQYKRIKVQTTQSSKISHSFLAFLMAKIKRNYPRFYPDDQLKVAFKIRKKSNSFSKYDIWLSDSKSKAA